MNFMIEHPLVFLGLVGVMVANAVVVWRIANNYEETPFGQLIPFPQRDASGDREMHALDQGFEEFPHDE